MLGLISRPWGLGFDLQEVFGFEGWLIGWEGRRKRSFGQCGDSGCVRKFQFSADTTVAEDDVITSMYDKKK